MKIDLLLLVAIYSLIGYYFLCQWNDLIDLDAMLSRREKRQAKKCLIVPAVFWFVTVPLSYLELLNQQKKDLMNKLELESERMAILMRDSINDFFTLYQSDHVLELHPGCPDYPSLRLIGSFATYQSAWELACQLSLDKNLKLVNYVTPGD